MQIKKEYIIIGVLFVVALIIRLAFAQHCLWVDEARDLTIARNLATTGHQDIFGKPYLQHPIFEYLLLIVGGLNVPIILGSLTVVLTFLLGKEIFNVKTGIVASLFLLVQPLFWFYNLRILNDTAETFFFVLSLYLFIKFVRTKEDRFAYLTAIAVGLGCITRVSCFILIPIIITYLILTKPQIKWKTIAIATGIFITILASTILYNLVSLGIPFDLSIYTHHAFVETFDSQPFTYYITSLSQTIGSMLVIFAGIGIVLSGFSKHDEKGMLLVTALILFIIGISAVNVKVDRYILPAIPIFCILAGYGLVTLPKAVKINDKTSLIIVGLVVSLILLFSVQTGIIMIQNSAQGFCGLEEMGLFIKENVKQDTTVMAGSYTTIAYYAQRENIVKFPENITEFANMVLRDNIRLIVVDKFERTQPQYIFQYLYNNTEVIPVFATNNNSVVLLYLNYSVERSAVVIRPL